MKSTGIVRKMDSLGRVVLPSELRKILDINNNDPVAFFIDGNEIILQKYLPGCALTGDMDDLVECGGIRVSKKMVVKLAQAVGLIQSHEFIDP